MRFFEDSEFHCNCGRCGLDIDEMDEDVLYYIDKARGIAEVPFIIDSSIRCKEHNATEAVGGSPTSSHLRGYAVDIMAETSFKKYRILTSLFKVGFTRLGDYRHFIHADMDPDKVKELIWG